MALLAVAEQRAAETAHPECSVKRRPCDGPAGGLARDLVVERGPGQSAGVGLGGIGYGAGPAQ
jgi:hypothetical protein